MNKNVLLCNLEKICFYDIETVGQRIDIENKPVLRDFIAKKHKIEPEQVTNESVLLQGGLYPETGKIICISVGIFKDEKFYVKSFYGDNEKDLLTGFTNMMEKDNFSMKYTLCGWNNESFDNVFIAKRCILNNIPVPVVLDTKTKQSWDIFTIDAMRLWAFGDFYNNRVALKVACEIFDVPTSKDDIDGSQVSGVYYGNPQNSEEHANDLNRIRTYCEKDVVATCRVFQKITQNGYLNEDNIIMR
jgi:uncharacterized protein YprB with RNaseH-like and TPR domain